MTGAAKKRLNEKLKGRNGEDISIGALKILDIFLGI